MDCLDRSPAMIEKARVGSSGTSHTFRAVALIAFRGRVASLLLPGFAGHVPTPADTSGPIPVATPG